MNGVGQKESMTQDRVIAFLEDALGYRFLGSWRRREGNRNIDRELFTAWLRGQRHDEKTIGKVWRELDQAATLGGGRRLYDANRAVYGLLRYGVKIQDKAGNSHRTIRLIDWARPGRNDFAVAEEVTVEGGGNDKRPDLALYVNGIALAVLELKRSTVSLAEGIRQNLDNQKSEFIEPFFTTVQLVMAGNETEGLRYGVIGTPGKYYLRWKEAEARPEAGDSPLLRELGQLCGKERLLELIHDFTVFDAGTKKTARHNQYFGVKAAQQRVKEREGGIIWHTQGSGKSLTMVWLARWIAENVADSRVLLITDRKELDEQIEQVFTGVGEGVYRTRSGADLVRVLNGHDERLVCSLIHKFGKDSELSDEDVQAYVEEIRRSLPKGFHAKGDLVVFVDECHRTQSGKLHEAMKAILPGTMLIGFTGTPLLSRDKKTSIETFGRYIHTYKYDEAVRDGVVLDLRYEARDVDQNVTSQARIDRWFEAKTRNLSDLAKAQLKQRWGTMRKVLSSQDRLAKIVDDILLDMETRDRLLSGRGNAMLVSGSIYQACKYYELFAQTELKGKCAIVTSYKPSPADIKGEETGEGLTERLRQYGIYRRMLAEHFGEPDDTVMYKVDTFEKEVKRRFVEEPGRMKLLIVVDKLLTGFDAPSATYLYIDKKMQDHGLFQAICRVNRLDGEDKEYGYVIDYRDLFRCLETAINDYTREAFAAYDQEDVDGLLQDRLGKACERLEETREALHALCEPVAPPRDTPSYLRYFCAVESGNAAQLKENEPKRLALYKHVAAFVRAFANLAGELGLAGYSASETEALRDEADHYEKVRMEVKLASGDYVDLKMYEPAMRHLIDTYIRAEDSEVVSAFDDMTLIELVVARGPQAVEVLPEDIRDNQGAVAETIENNVRRLIIDEHPVNPKYYDRLSQLLDALIEQRRRDAVSYQEYLERVVELARQVSDRTAGGDYPPAMDSGAKRALYDALGGREELALAVDHAIVFSREDGWRGDLMKTRKIENAVTDVLETWLQRHPDAADQDRTGEGEHPYGESSVGRTTDRLMGLAEKQNDY